MATIIEGPPTVEMESPEDLIMDPKSGYYCFPKRPEGIPDCESKYPQKYTVKAFTQKEIDEYRYYRSIRGYSLNRLTRTEVNIITKDGTLREVQGWVPNESGLIFRSMVIGLIKGDGWSVVERSTGIPMMPDAEIEIPAEHPNQLSFAFAEPPKKVKKVTGKNREDALQLAADYASTLSDQEWIDIQKQLDYNLAGIESEPIKTAEEERLENIWGAKIRAVNKANDWIRKTNNFINVHKPLRIHQNSNLKVKMTEKSGVIRVAEKANPRKKTKFFFSQADYSNAIEVEGIILPIEIDGLPEMKEVVIVKGSQFKGTIVEESHTASKYYVYEPYMGSAITLSASTIKEAVENTLKRICIRSTPDGIERINEKIRFHKEKILAAQSGEDIEKYIEQEL